MTESVCEIFGMNARLIVARLGKSDEKKSEKSQNSWQKMENKIENQERKLTRQERLEVYLEEKKLKKQREKATKKAPWIPAGAAARKVFPPKSPKKKPKMKEMQLA